VVGGQLGGFEVHVGVCERVLNCLVLTDGSGEDDSLAGVVGGSVFSVSNLGVSGAERE
jgi:hypothetical protein